MYKRVSILFAVLVAGAGSSRGASPAIGPPVRAPSSLSTNTPTSVLVTVAIADPALIPASVGLVRIGGDGRPVILGAMHDDGQNGDAVAGDHVYTLLVQFNEPAAGQINLQVSAAFHGRLKRVLSDVVPVNVSASR